MVFTLIARVALNISRKILAVMPRKLIIVFCRIENVKHEGMILKISHRSQSINLQSISLSINTKEWIYDMLNPSFEDSPQLSVYRSQYSLITKTIFTSKHNIKCCAQNFTITLKITTIIPLGQHQRSMTAFIKPSRTLNSLIKITDIIVKILLWSLRSATQNSKRTRGYETYQRHEHRKREVDTAEGTFSVRPGS